jgi:uncharacterized protein (DUF1697 family)
MITYVALLRGINVSGQKMIKMDHLKSFFESMKLQNMRTYIQSGNVLFESAEKDAQSLTKKIEKGIEDTYSFQVSVILRTVDELESVISQSPYKLEEMKETDSLYVSFLAEAPTSEAIEKCMTFQNDLDEFIIQNREVYILIHKSYGNSQFSNNFLEKKLKVVATTRNWATVNKLISMGRS